MFVHNHDHLCNGRVRFGLFFSFILLILIANGLFSTDFYVTSVSEINDALVNILPGDTITMSGGTWENSPIVFQANGTLGKPILLRAEESGKVILNGTSTLRIAGDYLIVDGLYFKRGQSISGAVIEFRNGGLHSNYCRLTNTAIIDYNPPSKYTDYKWVSLYGTHNRVDHCYFRGKNHSGTTLVVWFPDHPHYHLIDHNYFAYRPELGMNGGETIRIGTSDWSMQDSYTIVEYNYFEQCNGETEIISNKSGNNVFRYNTFFESEGTLTLRHGNFATVQGNFFFGNLKPNTGGVRVIGEDHLVFNNYFQDLTGTGYRSALSLVNGIPNSPLNGYFQVKRASCLYNTFVNCYSTINIGAGANSEQSLPPEECIMANLLVDADYKIITQTDEPSNFLWEGNIMNGPLGIEILEGITLDDPMFLFAEDSLWRPSDQSPAIGKASDNYPIVLDDMDGQARGTNKDVGADQLSTDPIIRGPLKPENVGPNWFPLTPEPPRIVTVAAGQDSLQHALSMIGNDYIIELVTDGGVYSNSSNLIINKKITIRAAEGLKDRPIIRQINPETGTRILFEIQDGGVLNLKGLELDGMADTNTPARYLIRTDDDPMSESYKLFLEDCYLHDVILESDGNFFCAYPGTFADSIVFLNCLLKNSGGEGIRLKDEAVNSGLYNVDYFEMTNCTVWNTNREAVYIYAGDDVQFTAGPTIKINHCTFDSCGYNDASIIDAWEVDFTEIKNSIFSNSLIQNYSVRLYGLAASIAYCDTFLVGQVQLNRSARIKEGMLYADPMYANRLQDDFSLSIYSPVIGKADDGRAMGDLRWAPPTSIQSDLFASRSRINTFILHQNYPNPFNPSTTIKYILSKKGYVSLKIYTLQGELMERLVNDVQSAGYYSLHWYPGNLSSGVYLCKLEVDGIYDVKRMMYLK